MANGYSAIGINGIEFYGYPNAYEYPNDFIVFIADYLVSLARPLGILPPKTVRFDQVDKFAGYDQYGLSIDYSASELWRRRKPDMIMLMRHVLAHEFRHYMSVATRMPMPMREVPTDEEEERAAQGYAERVTGITHEQAVNLYERLVAATGVDRVIGKA